MLDETRNVDVFISLHFMHKLDTDGDVRPVSRKQSRYCRSEHRNQLNAD